MPLTSPGNDDGTGENHQPTLRKNTAEPVEQTLKQNTAARKLRRSIPAFARVLAVELLCSCRSFDFRKPYRPGAAGAAVYRVVRQYANEIGPDVRDTWTTPQIEGVAEAILSGEVLAAAESAVGALK